MGVPTATSPRIRRMSRFDTRTHPCETACPSSDGAYVPWMPTMPPPGQSESLEFDPETWPCRVEATGRPGRGPESIGPA